MERSETILQRLAQRADLPGELYPGQPLVELLGQDRVLIENHRGIREYGKEQIGILCSFGAITVHGAGLELFRMTKEQLIIRGHIDSISLDRSGL